MLSIAIQDGVLDLVVVVISLYMTTPTQTLAVMFIMVMNTTFQQVLMAVVQY
jgi:hypothetical protein